MAGKFERKSFSEINLNDPFFDSLNGFVKKQIKVNVLWYLKMIRA